MILRPFEYMPCTTVGAAIELILEHGDDAHVIAGGTVVVPMMKHRLLEPKVLVSLAEVPGLREIAVVGDEVRIGALATHAQIANSETVRSQIPLLAAACGKVASTVIRSMGTIGGNVCYAEPASDPPAALLALDAAVVLEGRIGRRRVPVRAFFVDTYQTACAADEVLVEIVVPITRVGTEYRYLKWSPRAKEDKPLVGLAVLLRRDGDRCEDLQVGLSGVCPTPVLLRTPFAILAEQQLTPDSIAAAAHAAAVEVEPFDDNQASAEYRRAMVELWFNRLVGEFAKVAK
jgi:carbon-monoxide dehydrogenase medium subunit